jgi:hypothetical protein
VVNAWGKGKGEGERGFVHIELNYDVKVLYEVKLGLVTFAVSFPLICESAFNSGSISNLLPPHECI